MSYAAELSALTTGHLNGHVTREEYQQRRQRLRILYVDSYFYVLERR